MNDTAAISTGQQDELRKVPDPCVVVIFGASGDLTLRKLMPALFSLSCEGLLPEQFSIIGMARSEMDDEVFREKVKKGIESYSRIKPAKCNQWDNFSGALYYHQGNYDDPQAYKALNKLLAKIDKKVGGACNCLFYLSTRPNWSTMIG